MPHRCHHLRGERETAPQDNELELKSTGSGLEQNKTIWPKSLFLFQLPFEVNKIICFLDNVMEQFVLCSFKAVVLWYGLLQCAALEFSKGVHFLAFTKVYFVSSLVHCFIGSLFTGLLLYWFAGNGKFNKGKKIYTYICVYIYTHIYI